jgi:hypothetical protein
MLVDFSVDIKKVQYLSDEDDIVTNVHLGCELLLTAQSASVSSCL